MLQNLLSKKIKEQSLGRLLKANKHYIQGKIKW